MPNLETLLVGTWVSCDEAVVAPLLPSRIWDASEQQVGTADNGQDISTNIVQDHNSESARLTHEPESQAWPNDWELPKLRKVDLWGFPSNVFGFDWVQHCPKLEFVSLIRVAETNCHLSLRKLTNGHHIPSKPEAGPTSKSTQQGYDMPLYKSPLKSLYLKGPWVMSDSDLYEVLTDYYMPNLATFHVERLCAGLKADGSGFFQAIHDADKTHESQNRQSKLTDIRADYMLKRSARLRLGLVSVDLSLERDYANVRNRRARLPNNCVMHHKDWFAMKGKHASE